MSSVCFDEEMLEFWLGPMRRFMSWVGFAADMCEFGWLRCGGL